MMIKIPFSCEFSQRNVLQIFNISQKIAKFDIESDFQKSSFSSNLDKNNWTRKIGLSHPGFHLGMDLFFVYFQCKK